MYIQLNNVKLFLNMEMFYKYQLFYVDKQIYWLQQLKQEKHRCCEALRKTATNPNFLKFYFFQKLERAGSGRLCWFLPRFRLSRPSQMVCGMILHRYSMCDIFSGMDSCKSYSYLKLGATKLGSILRSRLINYRRIRNLFAVNRPFPLITLDQHGWGLMLVKNIFTL